MTSTAAGARGMKCGKKLSFDKKVRIFLKRNIAKLQLPLAESLYLHLLFVVRPALHNMMFQTIQTIYFLIVHYFAGFMLAMCTIWRKFATL